MSFNEIAVLNLTNSMKAKWTICLACRYLGAKHWHDKNGRIFPSPWFDFTQIPAELNTVSITRRMTNVV